eukprot:CAMPEP_0180678358 /NCGR_PEP_ID=MMETSP1037_2-20121125/68338_1 /TAXON_ID=632150 /ORGANISM="Azadinium spinosum, Strain 3D9" /LENGTH=371 /DNA_ID=CAMNT_0022707993 /DNA_START=170 /DNA_END=1282 /DNA_ORIENTATION=-
MMGDPEREYLDECMRDFKGLPRDYSEYRSEHSKCIDKITSEDRLEWLPRVRLTVDERICGQADLCDENDPGQCADRGEFGSIDYKQGDVTACYTKIDQAKSERLPHLKARYFDEVSRQCTSKDRWKDHKRRVLLEYCMWKHNSVGVCTNTARTNCPKDSSCCPVAQNKMASVDRDEYRLYQYVCRKSPLVGLFCQHLDDRMPGNTTGIGLDALCTEPTCDSFAWCRDLADVPGLCLGAACQDHKRSLLYTYTLMAITILGLLLDIADLVILVRWRAAPRPKSSANVVAGCVKLGGFLLCLACGIRDFADQAESQGCFNAVGNGMVLGTRASADAFLLAALLATGGSFCLAPLSACWGGNLIAIPYARVQSD